ncbi:NADH-quinone oxidoreductase subunit NuoN [Buchananella hordeovulneris]|uniref:NADH-quinone oxidoreductase subunit NuoN n=1 Tax=Buchananella hordeovulneris TaxID=52770 RepID=UPI0026DD2C1D|nr:NADH-quinone oxidoreductase subunit NuoN [Buchananella hordeovulneris]MDO5081018.1 NADH-quinone oxidoreductase subunit NuoN [Buchananella hordeovulneris]
MNVLQAPDIAWGALAPLLVVLGAGVVGVLVEAFVPAGARRPTQLVLSLGAALVAFVLVAWRWFTISALAEAGQVPGTHMVGSGLIEDPFGVASQGILALFGFVGFLVVADRTSLGDGAFVAHAADRPGSAEEAASNRANLQQTEVFPLLLFALGGMLAFPVSGSLVTLFIALEVLSLPLYVLTAMARRRRLLSQEAALKYFLLGAFASAFTLMGIAFLYGFAGSLQLSHITQVAAYLQAEANSASWSGVWLLVLGSVLVLLGLLFKVGAAPFHSWTPDVYQGAPTPVTGFMAAGTKAAATLALLRVLYLVAGTLQELLWPLLWAIVILTMVVGTVLGLVQTNIKRMLAYSSVAHAGFVLLGLFAFRAPSLTATLFYLLAYGLATIGAFAIVTLVRERDADGHIHGEATHLAQWAGLGRRSPLLAACMALFLLSFAGIPLTAGFYGKYLAFSQAGAAGNWVLVVAAVLCSAATAFFYVRLIVLMYFTEPDGQQVAVVRTEGLTNVAVGLCAFGTIILGLWPTPVLNLLVNAAFLLP